MHLFNSTTSTIEALSLGVLLIMAAYLAMRTWQRSERSQIAGGEFKPRLGFTNLDGGVALSLILENVSDTKIWVEQAVVTLSDLHARYQTIPAAGNNTCEIRQTVAGDQMLPVSIVESIYEAAGRPQGTYSCVVSASVKYRSNEQWFEKELLSYAVKMAAMTMIKARRMGSPAAGRSTEARLGAVTDSHREATARATHSFNIFRKI